jgi:hypothetical protein
MKQLTLFGEPPSRAPSARLSGQFIDNSSELVTAGSKQPVCALLEPPDVAEAGINPRSDVETNVAPWTPPTESEQIIAALHAKTSKGFESSLDSLLTDEERELTSLTRALAHQRALAYDRIVERLTLRWGELNDWPPFARVVEPGTDVKPSLRACTLELFRESRGLSGRVAFRLERDIRRVTQPIPAPVLRCLDEHQLGPFAAFAFLEPLYGGRRTGEGRTLLRSIAGVRRAYCRPIDPIVIAWLGGGPKDYGLKFLRPESAVRLGRKRKARRTSLGELVFLIGHWD